MSKAAEAAGILVPMATDPVNLGDANGAFKRSVGFTTAVSVLAPNAVDVAVDWGDGTETVRAVNRLVSHQYAGSGTYTATITGTMTGVDLAPDTTASALIAVDSWNDLTGLTHIYLQSPHLVTVPAALPSTRPSTEGMFSGASIFNGDISAWDVSAVTNMVSMFQNATAFNQAIGAWNTSAVTNMSYMFRDAAAFNQNIGSWNTSSVTDMSIMFNGASAFNQPIGSWNVGSVTNMGYMFENAVAFDRDIGSWDVGSVTGMNGMFHNATVFDQDLSTWCVTNIPTPPSQFADNSALTSNHYPVWGRCGQGPIT
jgi:surface protein